MNNIKDSYIALAVTQEIQEITKPLNDFLKISGFCYHKIFPNGYEICLSNSDRWVKHYHENYFTLGIDYSNFITPQNYKSFLWPVEDTNGLISEVRKVWGYTYGITLSNGQNEYFGFAKEGKDINTVNAYLNSIDELERFCRFFSEKAEKIIQKASQDMILHNHDNKQKKINQEHIRCKTDFKKYTPILTYPNFLRNNKKFKLTPREIDCVRLLIRGYTAKEIALILGLSFRTTETYIEHIKDKTGVISKNELIQFIFKNELEKFF